MKKKLLRALIRIGIIASLASTGAIFSIAHAGLQINHNQTVVSD